MYKIYINENIIRLVETKSVEGLKSTKSKLIAPYSGKTKMLLAYIDMLEKTNRWDEIILHHSNLKKLKKHMKSLFVVIKAAGGVVNDENGNILYIFRRGHWDLPKGKIDPGETKKVAAVREVVEETGVNNVKLLSKLITTRHGYRTKSGKRALKVTYWYKMEAPHQNLVAQTEEDITKAEWKNLEKGLPPGEPVYKNIEDVMAKYLDKTPV